MTKKKYIGIIISAKANKTRTMLILKRYQHAKYKKILVAKQKFLIHDENNSCNVGDIVLIEECAPISRLKNWVLKDILKRYKEI